MTGPAQPSEPGWSQCVAAFHAQRSGITEDVLEHAFDGEQQTPYDWAAEALAALPAGSTVLDLACGSAAAAAVERPPLRGGGRLLR